jgi:hypothetical protein
MCSYNSVNGNSTCGNHGLLTTILRDTVRARPPARVQSYSKLMLSELLELISRHCLYFGTSLSFSVKLTVSPLGQ